MHGMKKRASIENDVGRKTPGPPLVFSMAEAISSRAAEKRHGSEMNATDEYCSTGTVTRKEEAESKEPIGRIQTLLWRNLDWFQVTRALEKVTNE